MRTALASPVSGRLFLLLIAAATFGPLVLALLHVHTGGAPHLGAAGAIQALNLIAAPHVMATLYLLLDRRNLTGVARPNLTIFLIPTILIALTYVILLAAPLWGVMAFMLVFVFYGMWHFGRQNLGIVSFATRIGQRRPMDRFERWTLTAGMLAGVLGGYRIFAPALLLNPQRWPFDLSAIDPILSQLWYAGIAIYAVLIPVTLAGIVARWRLYDPLTLTVYLGCVFFFLPTYLSTNGLFLIMSWSVAHGIQYLVVLAFHAMGRVGRPTGLAALAPFGAFLLCLIAGVAIWQASHYVQDRGDDTLIKLLVATTTSLTWAHYWVDQFLWRFGTPERRAWLAQSFPFLAVATPPAGKSRPAKPALAGAPTS
jgi:hypothetical protein